jgi:RNA polymerase sigma factor (sigma-70 family)
VPFTGNTNHSSQPDKELVDLYKKSTGLEALGELYKRYMDLVYGVCLKYLKDSESAKDAVMQIFEELVVKLKKHEVENFKSWLYQVAKNYCLMQLRSPKNLKTVEINHAIMQNEETLHLNGVLEKEENLKKMEQCLDALPDVQRTVIQLFYLEGKCYNEIVENTGHEWNQVRSFIQNGRRNLKLCMEKNEERNRNYES